MSVRHSTDARSGKSGPATRGPLDSVAWLLACWLPADISEQSQHRFRAVTLRFGAYLERGVGLESLSQISPAHVEGFIHAPVVGRTGPQQPSLATMHSRRSAVRQLVLLARAYDLLDTDPTLDLSLPRRSPGSLRALRDHEVLTCRSVSLRTLTETRQPAAWALAEATARTGEIGWIRASDLELEGRRVWIHGESRTESRWGGLSEWGVQQLTRRLRILTGGREDTCLAYEGKGSPQSRQASACRAIADVFTRAGLGGDPDVRPLSLSAWVGARLRAEGHPIEEIARRLGMRSLDAAARLIGFDWREEA